eukprot:CAMPEP_0170607230 /NCGR_PEP_ID=MMETSP0224-20130122/20942_1 /TAXON_ID=285029 /ORGANISM="Togula jolla, Strain CCCM 725" /LENGTH=409 /DNA_ID=CAMNT_0010932379 /DNA_START=58 /DNA_END=1287 /DNA_ORIENTATION=+
MGFLGSLLKSVVATLALLVISLFSIGKVKPELLLLIPHIGFIVQHIFGGQHIPPFFDNELFLPGNFRTWVKDKDVIVATGVKSGTAWMCYCSHAIRTKGVDSELGYTDIMYSTPQMELKQFPGQTWAQRAEAYNTTRLDNGKLLKDYWDHPSYPFRVYKSHCTPDETVGGDPFSNVLPVKKYPNVKYIVSVRNGLEVGRSLHRYFNSFDPWVREMWGGFPPTSENVEDTVKDLLPGGNLQGFYFEYVKAWWPLRGEKNVLMMHYSDMVKDGRSLVLKLAKFLEVDLTEDETDKVVQMCSFAHMKENKHLFDYKQPLLPNHPPLMIPGYFANNEGQTGSASQAQMSKDMTEKWRKAEEEHFADADGTLLCWVRKGDVCLGNSGTSAENQDGGDVAAPSTERKAAGARPEL